MQELLSRKKAQTGGLISGLIFGIAGLVIGVIIAFVIVSTLTNSGLLTSGRTTVSVTNEAGNINSTTYTLTGSSAPTFLTGSISVSSVVNGSGGITIPSTNYTVSSAGIVTNATEVEYDYANFTYTYQLKSNEEISTSGLETNLTAGIDNVSGKLPTILLIAAIVLLLGVLALLVGYWQKMRMGGGNSI